MVYITESQLIYLKSFGKFFSRNISLISSPLVINAYLEDEVVRELVTEQETREHILSVLKHPTIHLGGSYTNLANELVSVGNESFQEAMEKLPLESGSVSLLIHPRVFGDCKDPKGVLLLDQVKDRLRFLNDILRKKDLDPYFYLPAFLLQKLDNAFLEEGLNLFPSPKYEGILYFLNHPEEFEHDLPNQFISVDQYNAFASVKRPVVPFLLNEGDEEQRAYLESYEKLVTSSPSDLGRHLILDQMVSVILEDVQKVVFRKSQ